MVSGAILILCAAAFYGLSLRLVSHIYQHRAKNHILNGYYGLALVELKRAYYYQPAEYRLRKQLGKVYRKMGELKSRGKDAWRFTLKAKEYHLSAAQLHPHDAEIAYGLAMTEARLEALHASLRPGEQVNPYHALPYFKKTLRLRPNGILYHYSLARYLYGHDQIDDFLRVVRSLARIYPPVYNYLIKEKFWSSPVREAVKGGLEQAIEAGNLPREAHKSMSSMSAHDRLWSDAAAHYDKALGFQSF